ncbi:trehalose-6-phosphate synthase [Dactylosporangium sucinum]|uniref:Trehalose-6-phosphate synthase n=1 Tax=Dactylosporangium sucinum TaxID=1424081 RepID=A0A917U5M6_9ACTN|nr:trehalose-6-phosphate synthase [Dactylosporangium sucinum]GGM60501.1 trehalose-6-phosphate synthase [Dactylosporangium sucinum]
MAGNSAFVVVANRLPVDKVVGPDGEVSFRRSPGGLVTALEPVLQQYNGTWVGWPGGVGDSELPEETIETGGVQLAPVSLSAAEIERYYEGFSNSSLWPLYHDAVETPIFKRRWWESYRLVNERFAKAVADHAGPGATVWVQDYQLQLVPALLRETRPDLRIGFFLHIPFPPVELFMQLPRRAELLKGLLGADLVGFQRPLGAQNFVQLSRHLLGTRVRRGIVEWEGRTVRAEAFPISIDVAEMERLATSPEVQARAKAIRAELGDPRTIILGVDRLDYTKGIERRLKAFRELLSEGRLTAPETVMVQVATPSRERVEHYQTLRVNVEREVGRINGEYGRVGQPAVHYLHQSYSRAELAALYVAADVMMVTPLRDGMNLVAKEYVGARADGGGALVLSEFAGAAAELRQAFLCNPHDLDGVKDALMRAIHVDPVEGRKRMHAMHSHLRSHDVRAWADAFLDALGEAS